jgi:hypothetical protein
MFEKHAVSDTRPRAAIQGIRVFAAGGKRMAQLRSLAASSAYTYPLADVQQTKHIENS